MPSPFRSLRAQIEEVRRSSGIDLGTVSSVDVVTNAVVLDVAGVEVTAVRWVLPYAPTVGDFVAVARIAGQWVVLGELSQDLSGGGVVEQVVTVLPVGRWIGGISSGGGSWTWGTASTTYTQGRDPFGINNASAWAYPTLLPVLPVGATVTSARVTMSRLADDNVPSPVTPRLYAHADSSVPDDVSGWTGPWSPGTVLQGQTASWDLPSDWLTGLLAGTYAGIGIWSTTAADHSLWDAVTSGALTVTFTE